MDNVTTADVLELKQVIAAPRERVYRAWTDADDLGAWFGPEGMTTRVRELDARPGGSYRFEMTGDNTFVVSGRFREMVPPERLVFTWIWESGDYAGIETEVEITFADHDGGTEMTLVHRRLANEEARRQHAQGWQSSFGCLAEALQA